MNRPKISIIIPVYNAENYISRCIQSLIEQTYPHFYVILVDDGSKDRSGVICDKYSSQDSRIRVIHKKNGGVSSARNCGLNHTIGEYVTFVDSDDYVSPYFLENFVVKLSEQEDVDLVAQSFWYNYEESGKKQLLELPEITIKDNLQLVKWFEDAKNVHNGFIWHRLFRAEIIKENNIRFPEDISFAEDGIFFINYLKTASNFILTSNPGYYYTVRNNSLTSSGKAVSLDVLMRTIRGYADALYGLKVSKENEDEHLNFSKRYVWRLLEGWIIRRFLHKKDLIQKALDATYLFCKEYDCCRISNVSYSEILLASVFRINNYRIRKNAVLAAITIRNLEMKFKRLFKYDKNK